MFILGAFGIQNGFQTHVTKLLLFPKTICRNAKLDPLFWFVLGVSGAVVAPFWRHFGGPWGPNGLLFGGFWGSGAVLGRLGRPVDYREPVPKIAALLFK